MDEVRRWFSDVRAAVLANLASGNVPVITRQYLPAVFALGAVFGCVIALFSSLLAVLIILSGGVGIGYAIRAFISYQRRMRALRERF